MISSHLTRRAVLAGGTAMVGLAAVKANAAPRRVVWWYEGATAAQQAALEQSLVKPFNASQSEYELVIEFRGSGLPDQLLVALSAGSGPDIILTNGPAWTQRMVIAKRLLPLNDLAKKFEWDKRIVPFMLGMGTYDGTMYALPKTTETQVLFYNDTLFKKNGWTPPTDRAAFEALADKMIKAGVQPLAAGNAGARYVNRHYVGASFSCCAGPDSVYNALSGKLPWNDPVFVESIQLLKNWWDKGYFGGPKYFALSGQQSFALMAIGKSGMAIQGSWAFQWVDESFKKTGIHYCDVRGMGWGMGLSPGLAPQARRQSRSHDRACGEAELRDNIGAAEQDLRLCAVDILAGTHGRLHEGRHGRSLARPDYRQAVLRQGR